MVNRVDPKSPLLAASDASEASGVAPREALFAIELSTIARGIVVLDAMAKRAETTRVTARTLSPGRYLIVLTADVANLEEAMDAALTVAAEAHVDHVLIRDPARPLLTALAHQLDPQFDESLLIVETATVCSLLIAADRALKEAEVWPIELRMGAGLSGKGVVTLTGSLSMIDAAKEVIEAILPEDRIVSLERIAQTHPDLPELLLDAEPPYPRGPK